MTATHSDPAMWRNATRRRVRPRRGIEPSAGDSGRRMFRIASSDDDDLSACACDRPPRCGSSPALGAGQGDAHAQASCLRSRGRTIPQYPRRNCSDARPSRRALPPRVIGSYAKGCIAGAAELPIDGATWQVMRLSRNRNWGHPRLVALRRAGRPAASADQRLAGPSRRRHGAAARRTDADGPCLSPGRARRGYLAHPDAARSSRPRRARGDVRNEHGPRRPARHRPGRLDAPAHRPSARGREGTRSRSPLRESRDQEGALPGGRQRPRMAHKSPADLRPQLSLSHPHRLSAAGDRAATTRARPPPATAAAKSSTLVHPRMLFPEARPAAAADDDGATAGRMPAGPCRTLMRER